MSLITKPNVHVADTTILAAKVNENDDTMYTDYGGNINNDNIADDAGILQTKISNVVRNIDALKLGGYEAKLTPTTLSILPLDADGKIVGTVIKDHTIGLDQLETDLLAQQMQVWDSGWFAVTGNNTYSKNHTLGKVPKFVQTWVAENADGTGWCVQTAISTAQDSQCAAVEKTAAQIIIRAGGSAYNQVANFKDKNGTHRTPTSGYCRIVAMG